MTTEEKKVESIQGQSMLRSPLFRRFLIPVVLTGLSFTIAIYSFSVPYLKRLVYAMEERAVLTNLTNIAELVKANSLAIEAYRDFARKAYERQLKNITLFQETYLRNKYQLYVSGMIPEEGAKESALEELRGFRYGNNNYVWVADYKGLYISHPDPQMHMVDFSNVHDVFGKPVLMPLIEMARERNEGYYSYWWQRLGEGLPAEQLSYARLFPEWEWVIGTGVFLDDIEEEVIIRKEKMIEELHDILKTISISRTGHMYIFDSWQNIIIHPDRRLENTNMSDMKNPETGKSLAVDLMNAAVADDHRLVYLWDKPTDKGNYVYEKIDWVKYVKGLDWYVVASVYTEELNSGAVNLRNKILVSALVVFVLSIAIVVLLMGRLLRPIRKLSYTAEKIESGDLTARCDIKGRDEIAFLATAFNNMVQRLRTIIEELDQKVLERTRELDEKNFSLEREVGERRKMQEEVSLANRKLTAWVDKLEQRNKEISLLNRMAEMLQACHNLEETHDVVSETISQLFPRTAGALYMIEEDGETLKQVNAWGGYRQGDTFVKHNCWAFRQSKVYVAQKPGGGQICAHVTGEGSFVSFCLPLVGHNEAIGLVHLIFTGPDQVSAREEREALLIERKRLATAVADQLAMAQANLRLRERLHHLSVRDGLTGLFNRRYMEETLWREFKNAERTHDATGVIMIDVDYFKKFNDSYGHEAGDQVLIGLAAMLRSKLRAADVVCRYGGEEFVIIMPGTTLEQALKRAELICRSVENEMRIDFHGQTFRVTISVGVAAFPQHGRTTDQVLFAADKALYKGKESGRNKVVAAQEREGPDITEY